MHTRVDIEFGAEDGLTLRGWLYLPADAQSSVKCPGITMAHGFAAVKEHGLDPIAQEFARAGFVVLVHDHRGFGSSDGAPRHDIDPWRQIADWRYAISYLESRPEVDAERIGLWGTSYSGGHAFILGATDRRIRCVVAQVPIINGYEQGKRRVSPDSVSALEAAFANDDRHAFAGQPRQRLLVAGADPLIPATYRTEEAVAFYTQDLSSAGWVNEVTLRSTRAARAYEPGSWVPRVSPTPLLMIVAMRDTVTATDLALAAYEQALQPKRLVTLNCGHFDPYKSQFETAVREAVKWFHGHIGSPNHCT